ncbi:MAG: transcriptional repressor [bacterium]
MAKNATKTDNASGQKGRAASGGARRRSFRKEKSTFFTFLAGRKLKLTRQREAVVGEIFSGEGHFEAEEVVERLKAARQRVSRATVYRTLELLRECQLVAKLDFGEEGPLYEHLHLGEHHDHLICTVCGRVIEFHNDRLEKLQKTICREYDFLESRHSLRIFGTCGRCR